MDKNYNMKRKKMRRIFLIFCILYSSISSLAQGFELAAEGAWCWFADPRALHYENSTLGINSTCIGYIDVHGAIKATQHNFKTGETSEVLIRSYFQPDDHNNPSFLALPNGRIMIFYSRHTDEACFYYRISKTAGAITCKEGMLTTYINGLIDQKFEVSGLTFDDVTLGGFVGEILHFNIYNTALTQDQIKLAIN
jgi:hypothetical protein